MAQVKIYSSDYCPYCHRAKALLRARGVTDWEEVVVDGQPVRALRWPRWWAAPACRRFSSMASTWAVATTCTLWMPRAVCATAGSGLSHNPGVWLGPLRERSCGGLCCVCPTRKCRMSESLIPCSKSSVCT